VRGRLADELAAFDRHLADERGVSRHTRAAYGKDLGRFAAFLSTVFWNKPLEKVAARDVDALAVRSYLAHLRADGLTKASIGRHLSALRTFFAFLKREGHVGANPAKAIATPRREHALPRTLSVTEAGAVVEAKGREGALGARDRALLELLYATGLRVSELVGLELEDVDLSARQVRTVGKGKKERIVPFGRAAADAVKTWLKARGEMRPGRHAPGREGRGVPVPERTRGAPDGPQRAAHPRPGDARGGRGPPRLAARAPALLRDAPPRRRRRPALHPGAPRTRVALDDAEVHPPRRRTPPRGLPQEPPEGRGAGLTPPGR
jgi:site-specific recombinase XerD